MNRQIKFRGKRLDNGEWVYGHYVDYIHPNCGLSRPSFIYTLPDIGNMIVAVAPDTISQFTGLTDKNGTEIYEGDIIRIDCHPWLDWKELESVNAEVVFENFAILAQWKNPDAGKSYGFPDDEDVESEYVTEILSNLPNTIEVIGNIHDNPIEE